MSKVPIAKMVCCKITWYLLIHLRQSRPSTDKCRFDKNKVACQREFNYCFNCGTRSASINISNDEGRWCLYFKTAEAPGVIEFANYSNDRKFLINLVPISQYSAFINSQCSDIVEQAGVNWCPYCGINLEEEST